MQRCASYAELQAFCTPCFHAFHFCSQLPTALFLALQGGCMAIEDGYQLSLTLDEAVQSAQPGQTVDIESALKSYAGVSLDH